MVLVIGVTIIDEVIPAVVVVVPIVFLMNSQQTGYVTIVMCVRGVDINPPCIFMFQAWNCFEANVIPSKTLGGGGGLVGCVFR